MECGKVIRSTESIYSISCNFCEDKFEQIQLFSVHFDNKHLKAGNSKDKQTENGSSFTKSALHEQFFQIDVLSVLESEIKKEKLDDNFTSDAEHSDSASESVFNPAGNDETTSNDSNYPQNDDNPLKDVKSDYFSIENVQSPASDDNSLDQTQIGVPGSPNPQCSTTNKKSNSDVKLLFESHKGNDSDCAFECPTCKKRFKMKAKLTVHYKRVHLKERRFKCQFCEKRFFENSDRMDHQRRKHLPKHTKYGLKKLVLKREVTGEAQKKLNERLDKYLLENPDPPYECPICKREFQMKAKLKVHHKRIHLRERRFKCEHCDQSFFENYDRMVHQKRMHLLKNTKYGLKKLVPKREVTGEAQKKLNERLDKYLLENPDPPYECPICKREFQMKAKLKVHHKRIHLRERRFKCEHCDQSFFENCDRIGHQKRIHLLENTKYLSRRSINKRQVSDEGPNNNDDLDKYLLENPDPPYECPICKREFQMKAKLKVHHKRIHLRERRFKCEYCDKSFFENCDRIGHQKRIHLLKNTKYLSRRSINKRQVLDEGPEDNNDDLDKYLLENPDPPYECLICSRMFQMKAKLKVHHKRVHLRERRFKCEFCDKRFFDNSDRLKHQRIHSKEGLFICDVCDEQFATSLSLRSHREQNHSNEIGVPPQEKETKFLCKLCGKTFENETIIKSHIKDLHDIVYSEENVYKISENTNEDASITDNKRQLKTENESLIDDNSSVDSEEVPIKQLQVTQSVCNKASKNDDDTNFHCTIANCNDKFENEDEKTKHLADHHSNNPNLPFKCFICQRLFKMKIKLKTHHRRIHLKDKRFECDLCGKRFFEKYERINHQRVHTKETAQVCETCGKGFSNSTSMRNHKERCHSSSAIDGKVEEPNKCPLCDKFYKTKAKLKVHHKRVHLRERRFKCDFCEKRFFENNDRTIHQRVHTKELFRVCEICGRGFTTASSLRSHRERRHTKELNISKKEYKCSICDKVFARKDCLSSHLTSHNKEKKYTCPICSLTFSWSSCFRRHMNVHNARDFVCRLCGKDFTSKLRIKCHMKSHGLPYIEDNVLHKTEGEADADDDKKIKI